MAKEFNPANVGQLRDGWNGERWSTSETAGGFHPILATAGNNLGRRATSASAVLEDEPHDMHRLPRVG